METKRTPASRVNIYIMAKACIIIIKLYIIFNIVYRDHCFWLFIILYYYVVYTYSVTKVRMYIDSRIRIMNNIKLVIF